VVVDKVLAFVEPLLGDLELLLGDLELLLGDFVLLLLFFGTLVGLLVGTFVVGIELTLGLGETLGANET